MTTPCDIIARFEQLKGWRIGHEEGVHHGRWDASITAVTVCWKATLATLDAAGSRSDDLIIGHESLYDPFDFDFNHFIRSGWQEWGLNKQRRERLERHRLTFLRLHSTVDALYVTKGFAELLQLGEPKATPGGVAYYERPPGPLDSLVHHVKTCVGMDVVRVSAPKGMRQTVSRIGLLIGGAGLCGNIGAQERLIQAGCDVLVSGESDNYGFRYAYECGVPTIETGHELSEMPGIRMFGAALSAEFPHLRVTVVTDSPPWQPA
jgi:putative NIF3 family GTP cyclohydrolase 1 type 2